MLVKVVVVRTVFVVERRTVVVEVTDVEVESGRVVPVEETVVTVVVLEIVEAGRVVVVVEVTVIAA